VPRIYVPHALQGGASVDLPAAAARHVQVLRLQPGDTVTLFDGRGGEYEAVVERMGRSDVVVQVGAHHAVEREAHCAVHLALGIPANERMDWLVEKATELGAASIQPLVTQHSVVRLAGERAEKKRAHWQAIAVAACEQCGRNRVPEVLAPAAFDAWLAAGKHSDMQLLLSPGGSQLTPALHLPGGKSVCVLSGPEGGLSPAEESSARQQGFLPVTLGPRILRAETAPLAALAILTLGTS
jgi:16S rRNA (uracil1498-N3)-methyltransferase